MRRGLGIAVLLAALAGCTALDPYETIPLPPPPEAHDTRPRVGICFDNLASEPDKVLAAAQEACGPGAAAEREATDYGLATLQICPALLPGRATFSCTPRR